MKSVSSQPTFWKVLTEQKLVPKDKFNCSWILSLAWNVSRGSAPLLSFIYHLCEWIHMNLQDFPTSCQNCKNLQRILNDAWHVWHLNGWNFEWCLKCCFEWNVWHSNGLSHVWHLNGLLPLWVNPCSFKVLFYHWENSHGLARFPNILSEL